jgi:copper(I)-binding protein
MSKAKRGSLLAVFFMTLFALIAAAPDVSISDARIPAAPPGTDMFAAYFTVKNASARPLVVVGADSPAFGSVSLHQSMEQGGMSHMMPVEKIDVPANGEFRFSPGAYHLMLMEPKRALKAGDTVSFRLRFANHPPVSFTARVMP